ncbi:MAG: hypothetical protein WC610_02360 [Patescibacteria group bacterium]
MLNNVLLKNINLREGEKIKRIVRRSIWHYFWPIILAIILIILPFFLIYPLFQKGWWGMAIFFLLLVIGVWLILRIYFSHFFTVFVMTNMRIIDIDHRGLFNQVVTEALYGKIGDVSCESKGAVNAILRLGDIYINLLNKGRVKLKLSAIKNSQSVVGDILYWQENYLKGNSAGGAPAGFLLNKIKEKIGDDAFNKLITD